jgi:hypothetical protein
MKDALPSIPEGLDLISEPNGIIIRKTWKTWGIIPLALFAIVWDGFLFFWYGVALTRSHPPLIMILFPLGHVAIGVGITYFVVASLFNKTDIIISNSSVRVITAPLPWVGNKEVQVSEITDLVVRTRTGNKGGRTFAVMYVDRARKERKLATWISEEDQAEFVAQTIRNRIGLKE